MKYSSNTLQPFIEITSRFQEGYVLFTVADIGIGIDLIKESKNQFKPFRRFTKKADGSGPGLYIFKNIVEKNGEYIQLVSQLNEGITFYYHLKEYSSVNPS